MFNPTFTFQSPFFSCSTTSLYLYISLYIYIYIVFLGEPCEILWIPFIFCWPNPNGVFIASRGKGVDGFINEATVLGQDLFGRFTVNQAMDIWSLAATCSNEGQLTMWILVTSLWTLVGKMYETVNLTWFNYSEIQPRKQKWQLFGQQQETLVAWIGVYQHKYVNHHMVILDAKIGGISMQNLGFINDMYISHHSCFFPTSMWIYGF